MTSQTITDDTLAGVAETYLNALLDSADVDTIGVSNWWPRATTALQAAAASSSNLREMTSTATRKLQVETLSKTSAEKVKTVATTVEDPDVFRRFARIVERDALFIAAMVRLTRTEKRAKKQTETLDLEPTF